MSSCIQFDEDSIFANGPVLPPALYRYLLALLSDSEAERPVIGALPFLTATAGGKREIAILYRDDLDRLIRGQNIESVTDKAEAAIRLYGDLFQRKRGCVPLSNQWPELVATRYTVDVDPTITDREFGKLIEEIKRLEFSKDL